MNIWNKNKPLAMPPGSIRAILALAIVGAFIAGQVEVAVANLVLGFYFGSRVGEDRNGS